MAQSLPTRELNALRGLFDKVQFSADEVVALDYRVIRRLPGVGPKGIENIRHWLEAQGLYPENWPHNGSAAHRSRHHSRIEAAIRLLEDHGYEVVPPAPRP
ncbi:hypothetical protein ACDA63_06305 [Uliginosibacterium sp. sgz301328]|uniref:hypothetical protein n=1 Tax=Uliginosibacterium sp. sgz301328 TaxID=3243764 RepID=UPI00359CC805